MFCCEPSRRDLIRWSAVVAGAAVLGSPGEARASQVRPVGLELLKLTEHTAIFTWYTGVAGTDDGLGRMVPAASDGEIRLGTSPGRLTRVVPGEAGTPYHYVEVTGLEPGRTYYYQAFSGGTAAVPTPLDLVAGSAAGTGAGTGPFAFRTPLPPPGDFRYAIALCNDLHLGETVAGLIGGLPIKGISQAEGHPPYPEVMAEALVADARARGASRLLVAGDVTSEAAPADLTSARRILDGFGVLGRDYLVARGNHDRAHTGDAYADCRPGQWQGGDCYADEFAPPPGEPSYFAADVGDLRVIGLDTYDKAGNGGDAGALSAEQLSWFRAQLRTDPERPTLVFGHHPLFCEADPVAITGTHSLDAGQALTILGDYARTPGVFLHHAGHTHRNRRATFPLAPNVTHQEVAAAKEYPGGFSLLRVHTGGYALNYYKTRSAEARAWSERSRQELSGLWPQLSLGARLSDRNIMVPRPVL